MADYNSFLETIEYAESVDFSRIVAVSSTWNNKVWCPTNTVWIEWESINAPDNAGTSFPDPYSTGFGATTTYRCRQVA